MREAEARSSRCWDREPATCRVWDPSVACDQHLTLWRTQRRTSHEPTEAPPTRARRHQPPCRLGPTSAPSSYPFLRRSLGLGLGLACSFGDEQAPAAFVCTRPRSAAPAPAHVQLCVAGLDAPGARCASPLSTLTLTSTPTLTPSRSPLRAAPRRQRAPSGPSGRRGPCRDPHGHSTAARGRRGPREAARVLG